MKSAIGFLKNNEICTRHTSYGVEHVYRYELVYGHILNFNPPKNLRNTAKKRKIILHLKINMKNETQYKKNVYMYIYIRRKDTIKNKCL